MLSRTLRIKIPATTANLGPGYDCLGMALDLWNSIEVGPTSLGRTTVAVTGEGADELPTDGANLVCQAMASLGKRLGREIPPMTVKCHNGIPLKRGLGSSSAAIVGGLVAANHALGEALPEEELLELAVELEGHPDNVTPALLGGLRVVAEDEGRVITASVPIPADLTAVLFVPDVTISTQDARAVLPDRIDIKDAVYNMARVALLVNAMAGSPLEDLRYATGDRLHQPYRQKLFPAMKVIFAGAMAGGALGVFLSGSGSTIMSFTRGREMTVGYEMAEAARQAGIAGTIKVTKPTARGAHLE